MPTGDKHDLEALVLQAQLLVLLKGSYLIRLRIHSEVHFLLGTLFTQIL